MPSSDKPPKAELRAAALARRGAVSTETAAAFAERIATMGLELARRLKPEVVSAYFATRGEPSTLPLLDTLSREGFSTALPVTGKPGTPLVFRRWRPGEPTAAGRMAIREPLPDAPEVAPDLLFVPLAACDRAGNRIGYGAGLYDRTLAALRARKPVRAVGIAFACQALREVPHEAHDERLDLVLTETELIDCSKQP
jgi:5-formyltetrahydrofolate cyclo-ligase